MSLNTLWNIAFGPYAFTLDRKTLTYRLVETQTSTLWADDLSLGWIEIEERESGLTTRHDFGSLQIVSLSEKAGAQGKRILFGLDAPGRVPVDVYLTCTDREIQLTVEASRDTKTHRIGAIGLLPGLCTIPDDDTSYLVIPHRDGAILFARDAPTQPLSLPVWNAKHGLSMPFIGAVKRTETSSALALLTDSAYGVADLTRSATSGMTALDWRYERDPERRRLDIRIVPLPTGDHIDIARAYRDKLIGDGNHVTLRKKIREHPQLEPLTGAVFTGLPAWSDEDGEIFSPKVLKDRAQLETVVCSLEDNFPAEWFAAEGIVAEAYALASHFSRFDPEAEHQKRSYASMLSYDDISGEELHEISRDSKWLDSEQRIEAIHRARQWYPIVGAQGYCDWSATALDYWYADSTDDESELFHDLLFVPLLQVVYHDALLLPRSVSKENPRDFLRALLYLAPPRSNQVEYLSRVNAILPPLYRLSFSAFLTAHRFLTPDFQVEEVRYSNGAHIVINQSETTDYETDDLHLPPLGFYVTHPQMTAHDALRVGADRFLSRAWRIARSGDGR